MLFGTSGEIRFINALFCVITYDSRPCSRKKLYDFVIGELELRASPLDAFVSDRALPLYEHEISRGGYTAVLLGIGSSKRKALKHIHERSTGGVGNWQILYPGVGRSVTSEENPLIFYLQELASLFGIPKKELPEMDLFNPQVLEYAARTGTDPDNPSVDLAIVHVARELNFAPAEFLGHDYDRDSFCRWAIKQLERAHGTKLSSGKITSPEGIRPLPEPKDERGSEYFTKFENALMAREAERRCFEKNYCMPIKEALREWYVDGVFELLAANPERRTAILVVPDNYHVIVKPDTLEFRW